MHLDAFRETLLRRQRTAARGFRARLLGGIVDEGDLDELDRELFSRDQVPRIAQDLAAAASEPVRVSVRSRLGLLLRYGPLARLRPRHRALARALRESRTQEALDLAAEIESMIAREGAEAGSFDGQPAEDLVGLAARASGKDDRVPSAPHPRQDFLTLAGATREEDLRKLEREARLVLEESARYAGEIFEWLGDSRADPSWTAEPEALETLRSSKPASQPPADFDRIVDALLGEHQVAGESPDPASMRRAVLDLLDGLGLRDRCPPLHHPSTGTIEINEEDPPSLVSLSVPVEPRWSSLARTLGGLGRALEAALRSASLPVEHRMHADRAVGFAIGGMLSSLTSEYAPARGEAAVRKRRAFAREVLDGRLSAGFFIARADLLAGRPGSSAAEAARLAALRPVRVHVLPFQDEPLLDCADRLRGHMLLTGLRERLRTRFGNLWYRERAAGRVLEEICEPGGTVVATEIANGLSLPAPHAESLLESWREEHRRIA